MEHVIYSLHITYFRSFTFEPRVTIRRHLHPHLYRKGGEVKSIRHRPHCHTARKAITSALIQICLPTRHIAPRRHHRSKWNPPPLSSKKAAHPTHFQLRNHKPSFRPPSAPSNSSFLWFTSPGFVASSLFYLSITSHPSLPVATFTATDTAPDRWTVNLLCSRTMLNWWGSPFLIHPSLHLLPSLHPWA